MSSSTIIGATVKNPQGEELGKIQEVMIEPQSGRVVRAVIGFGGVLGVNEKRVKIAGETLNVGLGKKELMVEMEKAQPRPPSDAAEPSPATVQ